MACVDYMVNVAKYRSIRKFKPCFGSKLSVENQFDAINGCLRVSVYYDGSMFR